MRLRGASAALVILVLAGCGGATPREEVEATVTRFAEASAQKDYQMLCDQLLAPALVQNVEQYGLPCELAIKQGLGDVREPKLTLGKITVKDDRASAEVTTQAKGQMGSTDTLDLRRVSGEWRIAALG
ncbi:MAG: hypothetical protein H0V81_10035 [Solirubrobacterales bacterium]|nr:hypothetical protein [Solirubrobacterales bacterium]